MKNSAEHKTSKLRGTAASITLSVYLLKERKDRYTHTKRSYVIKTVLVIYVFVLYPFIAVANNHLVEYGY